MSMLMYMLMSMSMYIQDPKVVATTVFTPLEYGMVGYSEEDAIKKFGAENVDCYISSFQPLEWSIAGIYVYMHIDMDRHTYMCSMCMSVGMCVYVRMCVCVYMYLTYMYIYVCVCLCE